MRYRLYRGHKYVSYALSELERAISKTNFASNEAVKKIKTQLEPTIEMIKFHAMYEDKTIHELLRKKSSDIHLAIESDHKHHDAIFQELSDILDQIVQSENPEEKIDLGYEFYLKYRLFVGENLIHLHKEETIIMKELQRLYPNDEDLKVDYDTYNKMTTDQMIHMMEVLFPHMDINDHYVYLKDIKTSQPEKFLLVWPATENIFSTEHRIALAEMLSL